MLVGPLPSLICSPRLKRTPVTRVSCALARRTKSFVTFIRPTREDVLERVMGFEPTAHSLGSCCSTPELHPQNGPP